MTQQRDIERLLDHWFSDGPDRAPDRVVDVLVDRIDRQAQRPAWRLQGRQAPVNAYAKIAVAAAAVLLVAVIGYNVLPGQSGGVGGPATASPAPTSSPAASPASSANAVYPPWFTGGNGGTGILPAGSQASRSFVPGLTFTVPEGWVNDLDVSIAYGLFPDTPANKAEYALSGETAQGIFMATVESPYFICEAWEKTRGTAAERVASLAASEALAVSEPIDVTIGGLNGKQVDVRVDPDWTETCPGDPPTSDLSDVRHRATYLDRPDGGIIGIYVGSTHSAGHEAFLAEAMPIVQSFKFDTGQ